MWVSNSMRRSLTRLQNNQQMARLATLDRMTGAAINTSASLCHKKNSSYAAPLTNIYPDKVCFKSNILISFILNFLTIKSTLVKQFSKKRFRSWNERKLFWQNFKIHFQFGISYKKKLYGTWNMKTYFWL